MCVQSCSAMTAGLSLTLSSCAWAEMNCIFGLLSYAAVNGCGWVCVPQVYCLMAGGITAVNKPFACPAHLHMLSLGCTWSIAVSVFNVLFCFGEWS